MTENLDRKVKAAFEQIVSLTPDIGPTPTASSRQSATEVGRSGFVWLGVAASVVALGIAGLTWLTAVRDDSSRSASTPTALPAPTVAAPSPTESTASEPPMVPAVASTTTSLPVGSAQAAGGPTLFPMLDAAVVSGAPVTAGLNYSGASVMAQTNAVVARVDDDGSTSQLYTFVAGAGVAGYTEGVGVSTDASTPQINDVMGFGYAAWTADGVSVLVMAPDPAVLLDDPSFAMTVGSADNGDATLEFESLPAGFELLVEPQPFARQAATARLLIGSPSAPDNFVGSVVASVDNPLTNVNLTEGSTITPAHVGDFDAWVVSFPDGDSRTVVWSPDDTTWVAVGWPGSEEDLLTLATAVTFTDDVGEWMTRYAVALPPAQVDEPSADG